MKWANAPHGNTRNTFFHRILPAHNAALVEEEVAGAAGNEPEPLGAIEPLDCPGDAGLWHLVAAALVGGGIYKRPDGGHRS